MPAADGAPTLLCIHGTSRDDKLWPEADWIALGRRAIADGWRIALPQAGATEQARAQRLQAALGASASVWPSLDLGAVIDRMQGVQAAVGVDSGLSHIAVALDLPHVQIYNFPTSWRTGAAGRARPCAPGLGRRPADAVVRRGLAGLAARSAGRVRMTTASLLQAGAGRSRLESTLGSGR
jgi:ADP-heptose:LPS heptosyltransferase